MKLSTPRYTLCLFLQLTFLFCDLLFNCISLFPRKRDGLLVLFIFQDLFLVLSITVMLMTFFSTYLFQAGLVEVVSRRFRCAGAASALYAAASLALHAAWLRARWTGPDPDPAGGADPATLADSAGTDPVLAVLFTLHRCLSPWYYFYYKRTALRVSDPRFYEDVDWVSRLQPR